ncbi:MAG: ABC transporter permease [Sedimentibacter sp.]
MLIKSFKEECVNLFKNKINLVVLFVIPILTVILIGAELSGEVINNIPIAVINYDGSAFSRQLVDKFDQDETFNVTYYPETEQELEELMKNSKVRAGLIIPKDFYNDITLLKSPTVLMIYDGSHMSITSAAKAKATEILLTYKAGATIQQLTGRLNMSYEEAFNITQAFQFNNRVLYNPKKSFNDFLAPILMAGCVQAALALTATVSVNHNIYYETRKKRLGYASGKVLFYSLIGSLSFMMCIVIQILFFGVTFIGSIFDAFILSLALSFADSAFCVLVSAVIKNRMVALVGGAVLFIPNSAMAGTTWPLISMPVGYRGFAIYMPFAHYVNNIRNIYLKGTSLQQLMNDVTYLLAFGTIFLIITEIVMIIAAQDNDHEELTNNDLPRSLQEGISIDI